MGGDIEETGVEPIYISPLPELEKEVLKYQAQADLGLAVKKLQESPEFKLVFGEHFFKAYRETSAFNVAKFTDEQKQGYLYQITARSIVENLLGDFIEEGEVAEVVVNELNEIIIETKHQEEAGEVE